MPPTKMIARIGNSLGIVLDRRILRELGWDYDTWITMHADENGSVVVRKATAAEIELAVAEERSA